MTLEIDQKVSDLIHNLVSRDPLVRHHSRLMLIGLGDVSVPIFLRLLESNNSLERKEAVHALSEQHDPKIALALSNALMDDDFSVRWAAMEGLVKQGRGALGPMLQIFTKNFASVWMREGVHHVLRILNEYHQLHSSETALFKILDKQPIPGAENSWTGLTSEVAWAAERALEAINRE